MKANQQKGVALIIFVALLTLLGGYGFYRLANTKFSQNAQRDIVLLRLNEAKEALIADAVTDKRLDGNNDKSRPGRLLCPDIVGSGVSDWSLSRIYCDAYSGGLPGKTLRLANYTDETGVNFRYQISPLFGGNPPTAINSETETVLRLNVPDGSPSNDIVALIIATRGRLDSRNADGDNYFYDGNSNDPLDNDLIVAITRSELMAATESRIANELRLCLEKYPNDSNNLEKSYPWPAPLANNTFKGVSGSLFGMVPETQPGNPDEALRQTISRLNISENSLNLALTAENLAAQKVAVVEIQELAAYARAQFDHLFIAVSALKKAADEAAEDKFCGEPLPAPIFNFKTLGQLFQSGTKDSTAFTNTVSSFSDATKKSVATFTPLIEALINSGIDLFTTELQVQNSSLSLKRNAAANAMNEKAFNALLFQINTIRNGTLEYSLTSNPSLGLRLTSAIDASSRARDFTLEAKKDPSNADKQNLSLTSTDDLITANNMLLATIKAQVPIPDLIARTGEIIIQGSRLSDLALQLPANIDEPERNKLMIQTADTRALVGSIQPSNELSPLHENALRLLDASLAAISTPGSAQVNISPALINASKGMFLLANAIQPDPAREALIAFQSNLVDSINTPPATLTKAKELSDQIRGIIYWAKTASDQANEIARLSRKSVCAKGDSVGSAYTAARKLLDSIDGDTGSLVALEKPGNSTGEKVAETAALLSKLLEKLTALEQLLEAPYAAAAIPTVWYGSECALLKPPTGDPTWWGKDNWKNYFFYQVSDHIRIELNPGRLKVNGSGQYRVVVVSAGATLPGQDRSIRETKNFLEGNNEHGSRNGLALSPTIDFYQVVRSQIFNDRIAYFCTLPGSASKC